MKTLLLIDANSLIHRSYHALPPLTAPGGEPIGAIYGLASMLLKIIKEQKPDYLAAAFDTPEPTFREGLFKDYKAHRPKIDEALVSQLEKAHELFQKFNVPFFEKAGFEADDFIAALTEKFKKEKNLKIVILTGDLDALQLVIKDKVVVQTPKKGISETVVYDEAAVFLRYGLKPTQLVDWKGLVGDPSDNIPGVPGVGPKTATKVLKEYGSLENLYEKIEAKKGLAEKLLAHKEQALFSKKLATLEEKIPIEPGLAGLAFNPSPKSEIIKYFAALGFQSLIKRSFGVLPGETPGYDSGAAPKAGAADLVFVTDLDEARQNKKILASRKIKVAFDWKPLIKDLRKENIRVETPIFDLKIAGWLLDPAQKDFSLEALARRFLKKEEVRSRLLAELYRFFSLKISEYGLDFVFNEIEMPLVGILAEIEENGVKVNAETLRELRQEINGELSVLAKKIYDLAGESFNLNSSRQVGRVLFEKLGLIPKKSRKTKTGLKSTAVKVLNDLKNEHPIIPLILLWRENFKINSTFVGPLTHAIAPDGRVHTTFIQTGTSTGRLASQEPNLQNIPQESKWARPLREAFKAEQGFSLLALDYSQLELRLLAHLTGDSKLIAAFAKGVDAHRLTAAQIFNVPEEEVTESMRRVGKTLNFGVVYGMGARAFSEVSGLPLERAEQFIEEYFRDFPDVKDWQDRIKNEVRTFGYVKNENGRRRWFLESLSGSPQAEAEVERAAVNMPIQSLAADIMKLAMIKTRAEIEKRGWLDTKIKIILTIHDELLFEAHDDILKIAKPAIKEIMEGVSELSVPLKVEEKTGKNLGSLYGQKNPPLFQ